MAEKRILTLQDAVATDHVSPAKVVTVPVATVVSESVHKQQQEDIAVKKRPLTVKTSHPSSSDQQQSHKTLTHQLPTKPLPLLGMERRAHMMAERRQARMERQKQKEEQMLVSKYPLYIPLQMFTCLYVSIVLLHYSKCFAIWLGC